MIALGELLRCESCQSQQVVRAIFDHVDAQIVPRVNAKVRSAHVAKREPLQFEGAIERRMLDSLDFWNVHQTSEGLFVKNLTVRRKHLSQLESQYLRESRAGFPINRRLLLCGLSVEPAGLKQNRNAAKRDDALHFLSVEGDNLSGVPLDIRTRYKRHPFSQG